MGVIFSKLFRSLFGSKEMRILVLGLDNAGKTTILYRLHLGEVVTTVPTIGFNVETVNFNNVKLQVWDLGGQTSIRPYWRCYYENAEAVVFVVDSSDVERLDICKRELLSVLEEEDLRGVPLLVFANKSDLPNALSAGEISDKLSLDLIRDRYWHIQAASALKNEGLKEGLEWLTSTLRDSSDI